MSIATPRALGATALVLAALAATTPARAQSPVPIGTATGLGLGGMTEARFAEAALWNPALAAIFDGPMRSYSLLGTSIEGGHWSDWLNLVALQRDLRQAPAGVVTPTMRRTINAWTVDGPLAPRRAAGGVQWVGIHSRDVLFSVTSYAYGAMVVPRRVADIVAGVPGAATDSVTAADRLAAFNAPSRVAAATVFAVAKGNDHRVLPVLGRTWTGTTAKLSVVHANSLGRFDYVDAVGIAVDPESQQLRNPAVAVDTGAVGATYTDVAVRGTKVYGLDVGLVANPAAPLLLSVTVANVYQKAVVPVDVSSVHYHQAAFAGRDAKGNVGAYYAAGALNPAATGASWYADGAALARGAHFMPVVRVGASLDLQGGRVITGWALPLDGEPAIDRDGADRFSVGYELLGAMRPRVSYTSRFDGSRAYAVGLQRGHCTDRVSLGAGYTTMPGQPGVFSVSIGWERGSAPCGMYR